MVKKRGDGRSYSEYYQSEREEETKSIIFRDQLNF